MESKEVKKLSVRFFYRLPADSHVPEYNDDDVRYVFSEKTKILQDYWVVDLRYCKGNKWPRKYYKRLCKHRVIDSVVPCSNGCYKMPRYVSMRRWRKALLSIKVPNMIHKLASIKLDQSEGRTLRMERYKPAETIKLLENR